MPSLARRLLSLTRRPSSPANHRALLLLCKAQVIIQKRTVLIPSKPDNVIHQTIQLISEAPVYNATASARNLEFLAPASIDWTAESGLMLANVSYGTEILCGSMTAKELAFYHLLLAKHLSLVSEVLEQQQLLAQRQVWIDEHNAKIRAAALAAVANARAPRSASGRKLLNMEAEFEDI